MGSLKTTGGLSKSTFDKKADFLIDYISQNLGNLIDNKDNKKMITRTWETQSGIVLYLSYNNEYYGIRLVIYEK